jgi:diguanylate cyclase (GGDEF)-like protein
LPTRTTLFKKYALIFSALIGASLLLSGLLGISYAYQENRLALIKLQREKAEAAAARIAQILFDIEKKIGVTNVNSIGNAGNGNGAGTVLEQRSQELQWLRRTSAINEIALIDRQGKEYLRLGRRAADVVRSGVDFSSTEVFRNALSGRAYRSPLYFRDGGLFMTTAMAVGPVEAGVTVAEIDLEFLLAGISQIKVGEAGHAYAVDATGRVIAHPDIGLVLRNTSFAGLPQVQAALKEPMQSGQELIHAHNREGDAVLTAFGAIPQLGWFVFIEEPLTAAYRPLYGQAIRSGFLVLFGMLVTLLASIALVRKMVRPIKALQEGAALIGSGALDHRISVKTGDELEELANDFNRMAKDLQESYATLEQKVEERTRELAESNSKLAALSSTDALTNIANRRRFDEVLAIEWNRSARLQQPLALAMLDIDWFKNYNDHYGHQAGDECLRRVAAVLTASVCRTGDLVARYGGEEFVFIAPVTSAEHAMVMAHKVVESLQALAIPHALSEFACVTASIGIAAMIPGDGDTSEMLLKAADDAMYRAKAQGRNRVVLA